MSESLQIFKHKNIKYKKINKRTGDICYGCVYSYGYGGNKPSVIGFSHSGSLRKLDKQCQRENLLELHKLRF